MSIKDQIKIKELEERIIKLEQALLHGVKKRVKKGQTKPDS